MEEIIARISPFTEQLFVILVVYFVSRVITKSLGKKKLRFEKEITMKEAQLPTLEADDYKRLLEKLWVHTIVSAPTKETLLFQFPLLLAFTSLGGHAVLWIFIAAFVFMLAHAIPPKIDLGRLLYAISFNEELQFIEDGPYMNFEDDWTLAEYWQRVTKQIKSLSWENKYKLWLAMKQPKYLLFVLVLGVILGFSAVGFQSLAIPVFLHVAMNMWGPSLIRSYKAKR